MSDEKIDLAELSDVSRWKQPDVTSDELLALVAAVRAARAFDHAITSSLSSGFDLKAARLDMHAALAPFTDSAEVRDGR